MLISPLMALWHQVANTAFHYHHGSGNAELLILSGEVCGPEITQIKVMWTPCPVIPLGAGWPPPTLPKSESCPKHYLVSAGHWVFWSKYLPQGGSGAAVWSALRFLAESSPLVPCWGINTQSTAHLEKQRWWRHHGQLEHVHVLMNIPLRPTCQSALGHGSVTLTLWTVTFTEYPQKHQPLEWCVSSTKSFEGFLLWFYKTF